VVEQEFYDLDVKNIFCHFKQTQHDIYAKDIAPTIFGATSSMKQERGQQLNIVEVDRNSSQQEPHVWVP
jgi:hypothetical protein